MKRPLYSLRTAGWWNRSPTPAFSSVSEVLCLTMSVGFQKWQSDIYTNLTLWQRWERSQDVISLSVMYFDPHYSAIFKSRFQVCQKHHKVTFRQILAPHEKATSEFIWVGCRGVRCQTIKKIWQGAAPGGWLCATNTKISTTKDRITTTIMSYSTGDHCAVLWRS